jgi:hypothetical protein
MKRLTFLLTAVAAAVLCLSATTATATPATPATSAHVSAPAQSLALAGKVAVTFKIQRFVKTKHSLTALGTVLATFTPADGSAATTTSQPFRAKVTTPVKLFSGASSQRICNVLNLTLDKLSLNLLGLHVDLDKVVLNITANSRGGILGSLFCSLAGKRVSLAKAATKLNYAAKRSGLATQGVRFAVPANHSQAMAPGPCQVLDLVLGPLHLNLLGLIVDLNQVHLQITADPNGGILGSLLCSLTNPPPVPGARSS